MKVILVQKKFKISIMILYCLLLFMFYFKGFFMNHMSFVQEIYSWNNSYSIEMFNFIPFQNIIHYISNPGRNGGIEYLFTNILLYILLWIPIGYFVREIQLDFKKSILFTIIILIVISLLKVAFLIGFFDIDKILLACIGFCLGFYIKNKGNLNRIKKGMIRNEN